jgi:hypothetical protein
MQHTADFTSNDPATMIWRAGIFVVVFLYFIFKMCYSNATLGRNDWYNYIREEKGHGVP